jgi:hypothetical protein
MLHMDCRQLYASLPAARRLRHHHNVMSPVRLQYLIGMHDKAIACFVHDVKAVRTTYIPVVLDVACVVEAWQSC